MYGPAVVHPLHQSLSCGPSRAASPLPLPCPAMPCLAISPSSALTCGWRCQDKALRKVGVGASQVAFLVLPMRAR